MHVPIISIYDCTKRINLHTTLVYTPWWHFAMVQRIWLLHIAFGTVHACLAIPTLRVSPQYLICFIQAILVAAVYLLVQTTEHEQGRNIRLPVQGLQLSFALVG